RPAGGGPGPAGPVAAAAGCGRAGAAGDRRRRGRVPGAGPAVRRPVHRRHWAAPGQGPPPLLRAGPPVRGSGRGPPVPGRLPYLAGRKDEAAALVPAELLAGTSLIGPEGYVAERLAALKEAGVTTLNVTPLAPAHADRVRLIERVRDLAA